MSLFLKIFLWFWGATTALALVLLVAFSTEPDVNSIPRSGSMGSALMFATNSVIVYEQHGDAALRAYLLPKQRGGIKVYLFDPQDVARGLKPGERAPDEIRELASNTQLGRQSGSVPVPQWQRSLTRLSASQPVLTPRGTYVFVGSPLF